MPPAVGEVVLAFSHGWSLLTTPHYYDFKIDSPPLLLVLSSAVCTLLHMLRFRTCFVEYAYLLDSQVFLHGLDQNFRHARLVVLDGHVKSSEPVVSLSKEVCSGVD